MLKHATKTPPSKADTPETVNSAANPIQWFNVRLAAGRITAMFGAMFVIAGVVFMAIAPVSRQDSARMNPVWIVGLLLAIFSFGAVILGICLIAAGFKDAEAYERFAAGKCLAHWTYPKRQWDDYIQRNYRQITMGGLVGALGVILIGGILIFFLTPSDEPWPGWAIGLTLVAAAAVAVACLVYASWRRDQRLTMSEVRFNQNGVCADGRLFHWDAAHLRLERVELRSARPMMLAFTIVRVRSQTEEVLNIIGSIVSTTPTYDYQWCHQVLIPEGKEAEAQALAGQFKKATRG
jgi:hypothetical protein